MLTRLASHRKGRSGITLTEILISIMIMGVGIISLATLFPLGLLRLRNAQRLTRGAFLYESAAADLNSRNLLAKLSFDNPRLSPWYTTSNAGRYDPWVQDTPSYGGDWATINNRFFSFLGIHRGYGGNGAPNFQVDAPSAAEPGLPVAYDPLWRAIANEYPDPSTFPNGEARFGSGIGFVRNDPTDNGTPSAHGLQRVTNFCTYANAIVPAVAAAANYSRVVGTFVSPEDIVFQERSGTYTDPNTGSALTTPSTVVPDLSMGGTPLPLANGVLLYPTQNDWRYTWMFTGRRSDATDGATYDGDIVIHENRQFGLDAVASPLTGGTVYQASGETVVEAVWGYSTLPGQVITPSVGYGTLSSNRSVLLRWPASQPDPDVRVGGWIADVTYERSQQVSNTRSLVGPVRVGYPLQRCHWYQVSKKTDPVPGRSFGGDPVTYREMTVWVSTTLQARTPLNFNTNPPSPYHVEAALIAPTVVNVYPWSGIIR